MRRAAVCLHAPAAVEIVLNASAEIRALGCAAALHLAVLVGDIDEACGLAMRGGRRQHRAGGRSEKELPQERPPPAVPRSPRRRYARIRRSSMRACWAEMSVTMRAAVIARTGEWRPAIKQLAQCCKSCARS